jgi:predicted negative regulator of RcsB-dependent stress response
MKNKNVNSNTQTGFAHVELLIFLIVIAAIAFAGYHIYQRGQANDDAAATSQGQEISNSLDKDQPTVTDENAELSQ